MKKGNMKIKWESNSRVKHLAGRTIDDEDIIARTTTDKFPPEMATVRMARVREKNPSITIHFRGASKPKTYSYWDYQNNVQKTDKYEHAKTLRLSFRMNEDGFSTNGEMDFADLEEVVKTVSEVKEALNG